MTARPPRLVWKFEDGPDDAEDKDPRDVGPAWLDTFEHDPVRPARSEDVEDGEWITRAEARHIAGENGYELLEDG
jgi:hypothetical protein